MRSFLLLQSDYGIVMRRHSQTLPQQARSLHIDVPRIFTRWEVALVTNISLFTALEVHLGNDYPRSFCTKEQTFTKGGRRVAQQVCYMV